MSHIKPATTAIRLFVCLIANIGTQNLYAQAVFTKTPIVKYITTHFGANADDDVEDTWAFIKAGRYISNQWDSAGTPLATGTLNYDTANYYIDLRIPAGGSATSKYIVGRQVTVDCGGLYTTYGAEFDDAANNNAPIKVLPVNTGSIVVTATGGKPPYGYKLLRAGQVDNIPFGASNIFALLPRGTYEVKVKDADSCIYRLRDIVVESGDATNKLQLLTSATISKCTANTGIINANGYGGEGPFDYYLNGNLVGSQNYFDSLSRPEKSLHFLLLILLVVYKYSLIRFRVYNLSLGSFST